MTGRLALVHDWLTGMRGGEKALEVICERFPDAELFTLVHVRGSVSPVIERRVIHTSFLQALPGIRRYYRQCLPAFPTAVEQFDLDRFDLVLSISHCAVKSVVKAPRAKHLCYCLTPMRYAWDQFDAYFGPDRLGPVGSRLMRPVMARIARWDRDTADRVDRYVAISHYVAGRIDRYYNRESTVVYPPVDTDFYRPDTCPSEGYALVVSALVPYKRIDLAIEACARAQVPLMIAGDGPERAALERWADGRATFVGRVSNDRIRGLYQRAAVVLLPGEEDFGIVPLEAQACGRPVVALARGGALETVVPGETGELVDEPAVDAFADAITRVIQRRFDTEHIRRHAERFGRARFGDEIEALVHGTMRLEEGAMIRHNRLLVAFHVLSDSLLGISAFIVAYALRFHTGLIPITKGLPPLTQYLNVVPFVAVLVPIGFQLQGLYRLRRGRSRVDDFFAVFVGSILTVVFGIMSTMYVQIYWATNEAKDAGAFEVSQVVWAMFLVLNVILTFASRELVREVLERRWRAGIGLKRILIAGSGELGRLVSDKILEHRELGYQIVGFIDNRATGDHLGYRGLPLLGTLADVAEITAREAVDHLYVALPPDQHVQMIELLERTSREMVDVKVVPDLLQVIALRARLEDLDGVPVININDVPLQGFNAMMKRCIDVVISSAALLVFAAPLALIALVVRTTSRGTVFYRQERMGLDGKSFSIVKFRSMYDDAERHTGPVWAIADDPRVTPLGKFLRRSNLDELPQLWNVFKGDMSIVGPRPERPHFVAEFKHKVPQYMLRHKVKAGLTGWAQVNGWRGNTPLDKRIEYDLYYIENWSVRLDLKIMWLTLLRGFFHKHAY